MLKNTKVLFSGKIPLNNHILKKKKNEKKTKQMTWNYHSTSKNIFSASGELVIVSYFEVLTKQAL